MKHTLLLAAALALQACAITIYTTPKPAIEAPKAAIAPPSCTPESLQALPPDLKDCTCAGNNTWECTRTKKPRSEGLES